MGRDERFIKTIHSLDGRIVKCSSSHTDTEEIGVELTAQLFFLSPTAASKKNFVLRSLLTHRSVE